MDNVTYTLCIPTPGLDSAEHILIEGPAPRVGEAIFLEHETGTRVVVVQAVNHIAKKRPARRDGKPATYTQDIRVVAQ